MMHPCIHLATKTIHRRVGYHAASFIMQLPVSASFTTTTTTRTSIDKSQQAIEKAEQLHKELNQLIKAQKTRQVEESQRPFGSGVVTFLKNSKSEMFNIFFAFVCVLLAYQIHKMKAGIKKLLADQQEKSAEIDRLRGLLATLSKDDSSDNEFHNIFTISLAEKCAEVVRKMFQDSEKRAGYSWILGKKIASRDSLESETLIDELQSVLSIELQSLIGDAAYTSEELKERRVIALKEEDVAKRSYGSRDAGGLLDIFEEVHKSDLSDGINAENKSDSTSGKVRRTRYAI